MANPCEVSVPCSTYFFPIMFGYFWHQSFQDLNLIRSFFSANWFFRRSTQYTKVTALLRRLKASWTIHDAEFWLWGVRKWNSRTRRRPFHPKKLGKTAAKQVQRMLALQTRLGLLFASPHLLHALCICFRGKPASICQRLIVADCCAGKSFPAFPFLLATGPPIQPPLPSSHNSAESM